MSSKSKNSSAGLIALIIGGGAIAALAMSKPAPPPPPAPISKTVAGELRARAIADAFVGGPWRWLEDNTTQRSWTIDPPTNGNGRIQTNNIIFDDDSKLILLIDSQDHIAYRALAVDGSLLDDWTQDGFETSTDTAPVTVYTAETAGTDLKVSHRTADEWITSHYSDKILNRRSEGRIGRATVNGQSVVINYDIIDYNFRDGSSLHLEIVSGSGSSTAHAGYSFTAKSPFGTDLIVYSESSFIPYQSPSLQSSIAYVQVFNAVNAFNQMPSSAKNIVGMWLDTLGRAGGITTEQDINGVSYKGAQYDMTVYTTIIASEPEIAADLYYDRNSTTTGMYFYIVVRSTTDTSQRIKTHDVFPDYTLPYDRTKTTVWGIIADVSYAYLNADIQFLTSEALIDYWGRHCIAAGGILNSGNLRGIEYYFPDGSSGAMVVWTEIPRQFKITMSFTDRNGIVRDKDYEAFLTDYWRVNLSAIGVPAPEGGRGVNANVWTSSYVRMADMVQNTIPDQSQIHPGHGYATRQILTPANIADFIEAYGGRVLTAYNKLYSSDKWVDFSHGELDISSRFVYSVHYTLNMDLTYKYITFYKYERYGDSNGDYFKIQIINTVQPKYINGFNRLGMQDYWAMYLAGTLANTSVLYTTPGFQN